MGFSVSGTAAIIFATMFVTFGMWYTASMNSYERVAEAEDSQTDSVLETRNTNISIASVTHDAENNTLNITVNNTGAAQLTLERTDLIIDGNYVTNWQDSALVEGQDSRLWLAGEQLTISLSRSEPDRVKITTENGVSVTTTQVTSV